jgi:hypothetical protein
VKLNPVKVGFPFPNTIGSRADHSSGALKKKRAEYVLKDLEAAKCFA